MTIALVQAASATSGTSNAHAQAVALATPATAHNCLVACVAGYNCNAVEAVTSAASQDGWGTSAAVSATSASVTCEIWVDPDCAGGNATVNAGVTTAGLLMVQVFEFSGVLASAPVDVTVSADSLAVTNTSWSSGTSGAYQAGDVLVGMCSTSNAATLYTMTGPSSPWVNEASIGANVAPNLARMIAGYQVTTGGGTMTYAGTNSGFVRYGAAAIALKAVSSGGSTGSFLPFF